MLSELTTYALPIVLAAIQFIVATIAAGHVIIYKRDTRAAIGWVGIIWLTPLIGAVLYVMFGINRIQRRASNLRDEARLEVHTSLSAYGRRDAARLAATTPVHIAPLVTVVDHITDARLTAGNRVQALVDGDQAFPVMLDAIRTAESSITLCSYIFDNDRSGGEFCVALRDAVGRGVEVRVLIDAVGARYSWPSALRTLHRYGVPHAKFLPTLALTHFAYANLRNHRKILVVDGRIGFTGGMNIREGNVLATPSRHPIRDLHFRVEGPVVAQLQETFVHDWRFSFGELLEGERWFPPLEPVGDVFARGIADGPDEDFDRLRLAFLGAVSCAHRRIVLLTPYFLPDDSLISALSLAAMRGVQVDIVLPEQNNLRLVQWASTAMLWQVLERGCRVWLTPPPFDHSKLLIVDEAWSSFGSANWDPRSLRLNFEFNVECYDHALAHQVQEIADGKIAQARQILLSDVDGRPLWKKLRDGTVRLLSPYL